MGVYSDHLEPRLVDLACSSRVIAPYRLRIVPRASGEVLEIGFGSGLNLPHYDSARVSRLYLLEPNAPIRRLAESRLRQSSLPSEVLDAGAEAIPLPDDSIDTVLVTFTYCTVPDLSGALREARRVLKPGDRLLFAEHGLAPDTGVARWQHRIQPVWGRLAGGCHLTRDIPSALREAGFDLPELEQGYADRAPRFAGFISTGAAV